MMQSSKGPKADKTYREAEADRRRRDEEGGEGIRFPSARAALGWYFEMQQKLSSPQGVHPRTQIAPCGRAVLVRVDGGRGGDFDEVLATMLTIGVALKNLEGFDARGHHLVLLCLRDGKSQRYAAEVLGCSQGAVSRWLGRAVDTVEKEVSGGLGSQL